MRLDVVASRNSPSQSSDVAGGCSGVVFLPESRSRRVSWLKIRFRVLPLAEAPEQLSGRDPVSGRVVVGYKA